MAEPFYSDPAVTVDLSAEYCQLTVDRLAQQVLPL